MFRCRAQTRGSLWKRPFSTTTRNHIETGRNGRKSVAKERQRAERDQLTRLLKESPGKRDARNFLKHFDQWQPTPTPKPAKAEVPRATTEAERKAHHDEWRLGRTGVNLGNLYEPTKAIQNNPVFTREELPDKLLHDRDLEPLHLALVKLRQPQALDDETLGGIALTLSQMAKLGLNIAVVVDCEGDDGPASLDVNPIWESTVREQTTRVVDALEDFNDPGAFEVGHALSYTDKDASRAGAGLQGYGAVEVKNNHLLFPPIEDGIIPVIPPFAYTSELRKIRVDPDDVLLALTREFVGLTPRADSEGSGNSDSALKEREEELSRKPVLDRIILLEPLGGIPAEHRADGAHVFINLEAEYRDVREELERPPQSAEPTGNPSVSSFGSSNPLSTLVESEVAPMPGAGQKQISVDPPSSRHVKNLDVVHRALRFLPPSSSAIIITPAEAAISSQAALRKSSSAGVRTRRSKNPLIHNLLTDKPMTSSSLPDPLVTRPLASADPNPATFLKKGIPVTILPDPRVSPWQPPSPSNPSIELEKDPRINFPKLVELIEDSFGRKLDARDYLDRIRGRIAGVIIAGDYEGGAICTWEAPNPLSSTPPPPDSPLWVPYLDKFAVLTKSQGSGGVADIVWGALTRTAFPQGVCWRSRTTNPVNKWYFERAVGMWDLPDGYWTMFWTTEGVVEEAAKAVNAKKKDMTRWDAYVDVCSGVVPSWADAKKPD
ncbi:Amino-acid acetyltransferase, mitochondrial [Didymosphaeria variabile]|uniref:Amino-acid acetyltransferase, mitochondrial n=1 Tax=Didymosphaeria variabile TaxID=1932322 RepID=A0A9W9CG55_9PLEO|nr:Amino-acid acetyltransferase, mitochondrial [Didymosphaeria variabile]KAJ4360200.1 Amino-acid acetyltransferase, mitochondrial [Didymosphaeria variabile]